jgi:hypothetical protein
VALHPSGKIWSQGEAHFSFQMPEYSTTAGLYFPEINISAPVNFNKSDSNLSIKLSH